MNTDPTDRLARLTPSDLDAEQAALYESIAGGPRAAGPQHFALTDDTGALNGPFGLMLHAPGVGAPLQELGAAIRYRTTLTARAREIAILKVAVATDSEFEWYAHVRVGRAAGLSVEELRALSEGTFAPADAAEAAVVEVCDAVLAGSDLDAAAYADVVAAVGERTLLELVVLVGYYRTLASMLQVFDVATPVDELTATLPGLASGSHSEH